MTNKLLASLLAGLVPLSVGYAEETATPNVPVVVAQPGGAEVDVADIDEGEVDEAEGEAEEGKPVPAEEAAKTEAMLKEQAEKTTAEDMATTNASVEKENKAREVTEVERTPETAPADAKVLTTEEVKAAADEINKQANVTDAEKRETELSVAKENVATAPADEPVEGVPVDAEGLKTIDADLATQAANTTEADKAHTNESVKAANDALPAVGGAVAPAQPPAEESDPKVQAQLAEQVAKTTPEDKAFTNKGLAEENAKADPTEEDGEEGTVVADAEAAKKAIEEQAKKITPEDKAATDASVAAIPAVDYGPPSTTPAAGDPDSTVTTGIPSSQVVHPGDTVAVSDPTGAAVVAPQSAPTADVTGVPVIASALWRSNLSLDSRRSAPQATQGDVTVWAQTMGLSAKAKDVEDAKIKGKTLRVGAGYAVTPNLTVGVDYGYRDVKAENTLETLKDRRHEVGASVTQVLGNAYVDVSARVGRGDLTMDVGADRVKPKTQSKVVSVEAGYRVPLGEALYVEPQVQVMHQTFKVKDDGVLGTKTFHYSTLKETTARVGVKAGANVARFDVWSRVDVRQSLKTSGAVTVTETGKAPATVEAQKSGTGVQVSLGAAYKVLPGLSVGLDLSASKDKTTKRAFEGGVSLRYRF